MSKTNLPADLHISTRLRNILPVLTAEEKKQLKANIESDGRVRDTILFWNDGKQNVVVDGMHRWDIVRGTEIPFATEELHFADYEEAEIWILDHQLGRRNLLRPSDIRRVRGELYNRLKRDDAGHGDQKSGCHDDTPIGTAAEKVAEIAGVSSRTVKRDGARVEALNTLTKAAKVAAEASTDAEVKALAKLDPAGQDAVARAVRVGQAASVKEAIKQTGATPPKSSNGKPPKQFPRSHWYKQWDRAIGPVCRLVDKIASEVKEKHDPHHDAIQDRLDEATKEMQAWMGVK